MWKKETLVSSPSTALADSLPFVNTSSKKPTVMFIVDDTAKYHYDNRNTFTSRGVKYTTGLRQDFIGSAGGGLTWAMLKTMQDEGFEIAYHGMHHNYTGKAQYISENDIPTFISNSETNGVNIDGFIGPNGDYFEDLVFHDHFSTFKWARGGGTNGVANVQEPVDHFKLIKSSFIDDLTSDAALTTLKTKIDSLATRGTGLLTLCIHLGSTQEPYMGGLLDYIQTSGIEIMTVSQAYEVYGAILEYYDNTLLLGGSFLDRKDGNGGDSINSGSPHFILQKDGKIISNGAPVKMVSPKKGNTSLNGNTLPNSFEVGISIIQYGSIDDRTGFPNTGTLYNFNLGKNAGQQFQLFKAYGKGGIYYRESNLNNTWSSGMIHKLGVFRSVVPSAINATGFQGDFSADANYLYICYADNSWIRVAKDGAWTTTI